MRHLMWILTWVAVGIGGALGAATVIALNASRNASSPPATEVIARDHEPPVLVNKPRPGPTTGRSLAGGTNRPNKPLGGNDLVD